MIITTETEERDIIKAIFEKHLAEYLNNETDYLNRTLEHNIVFWARVLKRCVNDPKTATSIYRAMYEWRGGNALTLQDAEDAITAEDEPICKALGEGLWEK